MYDTQDNRLMVQLLESLLCEDYESSLNGARNTLKNNGVEDYEKVIKEIEGIYNSVNEVEELEKVNKASHLQPLAFWYVGDPSIERIKTDFMNYLSTQSLYSKNFLINSMNDLKKEITDKKLFKISDEKTRIIRRAVNNMVSEIHSEYVPSGKDAKLEDLSDDKDNVVYEDDTITVYLADSMNKCIKYGRGSSLCIATRGG